MAQRYLYIVDHYVPFPQSEYGGLWNVIAENDSECFDLIVAQDDNEDYRQHYTHLKENINKSRTFAIMDEQESRVIEEFIT
jgi:hypothetical protein